MTVLEGTDADAAVIDLALAPDFDLGGLHVSPAHRSVSMGDVRRDLEPKVMLVLVALADERSRVVSRDRLIARCWAGRIVGDDAINRCIVALRRLARDVAPNRTAPFTIETIARVGYCLNVGDNAHRVALSPPPAASTRRRPGWGRQATIAAVVAALLIAAWAIVARQPDEAGGPAAIVVLPFRNLSPGDGHLAEGIAGEISGRLAREPQFRVAGRTSASLFRNAADLRTVGRRLGVDYVLEGSVQIVGDRVRINAAMVNTSDGMQLWSDSYDRSQDDIFAIQQEIAHAIAEALKHRLTDRPRRSETPAANGDAYRLYLTARGMLRERDSASSATAADLLRRAVRLDPGYAPAWSSLGAAVWLGRDVGAGGGSPQALQESISHVRRALRLAPDLAEAHGTLGMLMMFQSGDGTVHIRRAVELDPSSAENLYWLGNVYGQRLEFGKQLAAYQAAVERDPLWFRPVREAALLAIAMGDPAASQRAARRYIAADEAGIMLRARMAFAGGDFSKAIRIWTEAERVAPARWRRIAPVLRDDALALLGLRQRATTSPADAGTFEVRIWMPEPPQPKTFKALLESRARVDVDADYYIVATKRLLDAGRHRELLSYYDGDTGLLGLGSQHRSQAMDLVLGAPLIALALQRGGRTTEADRLLEQAGSHVQAALRQLRVPAYVRIAAAQVWAVRGETERALSELERAVDAGWLHTARSDLPDIADEPAFESLIQHPRFRRVRERINEHLERERRETEKLPR